MKPIVLLSLVVLAAHQAACYLDLDNLDLRAVSMLRSDLRAEPKPKQCQLFWKGLRELVEKLHGIRRQAAASDVSVDMETLIKLSQTLHGHESYQKLAVYVDDCIVQLIDHPRFSLAREINAAKGQGNTIRPAPRPQVAGPQAPAAPEAPAPADRMPTGAAFELAQRWRENLGK